MLFPIMPFILYRISRKMHDITDLKNGFVQFYFVLGKGVEKISIYSTVCAENQIIRNIGWPKGKGKLVVLFHGFAFLYCCPLCLAHTQNENVYTYGMIERVFENLSKLEWKPKKDQVQSQTSIFLSSLLSTQFLSR